MRLAAIDMTVDVAATADTPSITDASTNEDTQSSSGLVISRNAADGAEVTHFKITNVQNGTLFLHDGTTPVADGDFVSFADANAGLKFTPAENFNGTATFSVQASLGNSDAGLGGDAITAGVSVIPVNDTPTVTPEITTIELFEDAIGGGAASFQVTTEDVDQGETGVTVTQGQYGAVTSSAPDAASTTVRYQLSNNLDAVQLLAAGEVLTDSFNVISKDGTVLKTISVTIHGSDGAPINGDGADNTLVGTRDRETIDGKAGNDLISGHLARDTLIGGDGDDRYFLGSHVPAAIVELSGVGSGTDTITSTISRSLETYANVENLVLVGDRGNRGHRQRSFKPARWIAKHWCERACRPRGQRYLRRWRGRYGRRGSRRRNRHRRRRRCPHARSQRREPILLGTAAIAGTGNALSNRLDGSQNSGANVLVGLAGNDTYVVGVGDSIVEAVGGGTDIVGAFASHTLAANVENLTLLGTAAISGTGNGLANTLDGAQNAGANGLSGLGGDDFYFVGTGDTVVESVGGGLDVVHASVTHTLAANVENLVLLGTAVIAGVGNALGNRLDGSKNSAANSLVGLAGNDVYVLGAGDSIVEAVGGGTDIVGTASSYSLAANVENLVLLGNAAIAGTGNGLANMLDGAQNIRANVLKGLAGNDTYFVGAGDVVVEAAGAGTSDVVRSLVNYTLGANVEHLVLISTVNQNGTGNSLANTIYGNAKNNVLNGLGANDTLNGLAGNDTLTGGVGIDFLAGGAGNDIFVFNAPLSRANLDSISDFDHVADTFRLENAVMTTIGGVGALKANFFFAGASAHDRDDRIIYNRASGGLFYDDDGIGSHAAVQLAYLPNKPVLAANDFAVI